MTGLGGTRKKERSREMTAVKMDVVGDAYEGMIGERRSVLVVEDGTADSVVGYDRAYRHVAIPEGETDGLAPGEVVDVEVTGHNTVYALGQPASLR
jgi:tRNA A37 methylthiotransferase MiaB